MKTAQLANAITMIEEDTLFDILEERHKRITREDCSLVMTRRFSFAVAALAAVCFLVGIFAAPRFINQPNSDNQLDAPQYIAAFRSPALDALYKEYPYSELLPQKVPETLAFVSSYITEYDPIANPNNGRYMAMTFRAEKTNSFLEVKVITYDGREMIADPQKPDTYDLALYYGYLETPGTVGADAPNVIGLFKAEDITKQIVEKRMYVFPDGLCMVEIDVLCGDFIVHYSYAGIKLSSQLFYDMITSSRYFMDEAGNRSALSHYDQAQLPKS